MAPENAPPQSPAPRRTTRWSAARSSPASPYRFAFRLIGIPAIAVASVLIYRGLHDRLVLPECDSESAKHTLEQVFKELGFAPLRYEPIKTISSNKTEIVCNAVLPLPDGGNVVADYKFYWQGNKADMKYSISRHMAGAAPADPSPPTPPAAAR